MIYQSDLIELIAEWLNANRPPAWDGITRDAVSGYSHVHIAESDEEKAAVVVLPAQIDWVRRDRGSARPTHEIDIVIFGKQKDDETVKILMNGMEDVAMEMMQSPLDDSKACVIGVTTVNAAKAGYVKDSLHRDARPYIGGIRVTFNVY